jgi:sugar diacid utilization regulator
MSRCKILWQDDLMICSLLKGGADSFRTSQLATSLLRGKIKAEMNTDQKALIKTISTNASSNGHLGDSQFGQ